MGLITIDDIRAAAKLIDNIAVRTPLLPAPWGDPDRPLWLKPENLQPIGAFKIRGAYAAIAALPTEIRAHGVVAYSSGNHGQGVAYAAKLFGIPAAIVIEDHTAPAKIAAIRSHGAEVILTPLGTREERADQLAAERGATLIPPFDSRDVIAGQGTVGLEIAADLPDVDLVLAPISGGGLASGVGVAIKALCPHAKVYGVEPDLAADTAEGFRTGRRANWSPELRSRTIADGLGGQPSELTFAHLSAVLDGIVTVSEDEIRQTVGIIARNSRLVSEPSGAVAVAAYLYRKPQLPQGKTVAIISGGNLDPALFAELIQP
jgi:threonine dehydratase